MKKLLPLLLLGAFLAGCPKQTTDTTVAGTDEQQLDQYSARLEELRTRLAAEPPPCEETCKLAKEVCTISQRVCDIATRRPDAQDRCVAANEDCARFNDTCGTCSGN